ncbi:centromere protein H-like [Morphnus guianensis]
MECSAAVHASQESYPDHAIEEKLIKRFQLMDALRNKVKQNDNDSCLILETMKHIILLSTAILESQQQAHEMEQKLNDIKRKILCVLVILTLFYI